MQIRLLILIWIGLLLSSCTSWWQEKKETATLHLQMGTSLYDSGRYPEALSELLKAESIDGSNPLIQNNLGLVYFVRERYDLAENHLRRAVSLKSDYTDAKNNLARVLIESGKFSEAESVLKDVLSDLTYISADKAYFNLGLLRFRQNQFSYALQALEKSLQNKRENCLANTLYGRSLFELKKYQLASEALDRAVGYCQRLMFDEPHYFSAISYYRLGDKARASTRLEELVKLYPNGKYHEKARALLKIMNEGSL